MRAREKVGIDCEPPVRVQSNSPCVARLFSQLAVIHAGAFALEAVDN